jgi:hypothetical protein
MKTKFSLIGMILGIISLVIAVLHFWLGPIEKVTLEDIAIKKAREIKHAITNTIMNKEEQLKEKMGPDRLLKIAVVITALTGLISGIIGFVQKENIRYCASAIGLSAATIALQYILFAIAMVVLVIVIMTIISKFELT